MRYMFEVADIMSFHIVNICYILHLKKRVFIRTYNYANAISKV